MRPDVKHQILEEFTLLVCAPFAVGTIHFGVMAVRASQLPQPDARRLVASSNPDRL
jgi:hypothetical protein